MDSYLMLVPHRCCVKQVSKKYLFNKKSRKEHGHFEGKYWCDCKTRNYRKWLAIKRGGQYVE
jgi:hypothetical protein